MYDELTEIDIQKMYEEYEKTIFNKIIKVF